MTVFGPYPALCIGWHDGDTGQFDIDLGFDHIIRSVDFDGKTRLSCRVYGINAPELSTPEGKLALTAALGFCPVGMRVEIWSHGWDKFGGRFDGTIALLDGTDFATRMLDAGLAVPYP